MYLLAPNDTEDFALDNSTGELSIAATTPLPAGVRVLAVTVTDPLGSNLATVGYVTVIVTAFSALTVSAMILPSTGHIGTAGGDVVQFTVVDVTLVNVRLSANYSNGQYTRVAKNCAASLNTVTCTTVKVVWQQHRARGAWVLQGSGALAVKD